MCRECVVSVCARRESLVVFHCGRVSAQWELLARGVTFSTFTRVLTLHDLDVLSALSASLIALHDPTALSSISKRAGAERAHSPPGAGAPFYILAFYESWGRVVIQPYP